MSESCGRRTCHCTPGHPLVSRELDGPSPNPDATITPQEEK